MTKQSKKSKKSLKTWIASVASLPRNDGAFNENTKMKLKISILSLLLFLLTPAHAALDLELTKGVAGAIPIAVVPFAGQEDGVEAPDNIAGVIAADLSHSGRFKVADMNKLQQTPHDNQSVDYNYWQKSGNNDLVVGKVTPMGDGKYQVNFQLINLFAGKTQQADKDFTAPVLLNTQFIANQNNLRAVAHHISDLVYQQLTGDRGIFSTKIAYVEVQGAGAEKRYLLEVADQDGYNAKTLLTSNEPIMSPTWAPNGRQIAYVSFEGGNDAIYVQDVATGARRAVSRLPGMNTAPAWSPDSQKLALVLTKTGYPKIYTMNLASGQLTQITDGFSLDTEPSFSPDGKSLIFTSDRGGSPQIYMVNLASRQIQRLTYNGNYNARGSFSADGNDIVMLTQSGSGYDIAIQDLQNGRVTQLTNSGNTQSPTFAPNGKMVAYADQSGVLGMVATDGSVKLRVPAGEGSVQEPAWSPFLK